MQISILPCRAVGSISAPPSKSMAHRLLICAALSEGRSVIRGISESEDVRATLDCLSALGADCRIEGDCVTVEGIDPTIAVPRKSLCCRESGSTLRFLIPVALLSGRKVNFVCEPSLARRPMEIYCGLSAEKNFLFAQDGQSITVQGPLSAGEYRVAGNISSQFISGLLFALPLCRGDSIIRLIPPIESRSYIELTLSALRTFGVEAEWQDRETLRVRGGQRYLSQDTMVEGDYSNAAFLDALNLLGGEVAVTGLSPNSLQGDRVYRNYFERLKQKNAVLNIEDCPDLGPILFAMAAVLHGATFTGTRRLSIKESDRATAMAQELAKCGVGVRIYEDSVMIENGSLHAPIEPFDGHNDHRIVMATAILCTLLGGSVRGAEAVKKSFPDFFVSLKRLGVEVQEHE